MFLKLPEQIANSKTRRYGEGGTFGASTVST